MVMTFLSHFMTFTILSPHKFNEVTENLMLVTLPNSRKGGTIELVRGMHPGRLAALDFVVPATRHASAWREKDV
jgi:hypothetical protein